MNWDRLNNNTINESFWDENSEELEREQDSIVQDTEDPKAAMNSHKHFIKYQIDTHDGFFKEKYAYGLLDAMENCRFIESFHVIFKFACFNDFRMGHFPNDGYILNEDSVPVIKNIVESVKENKLDRCALYICMDIDSQKMRFDTFVRFFAGFTKYITFMFDKENSNNRNDISYYTVRNIAIDGLQVFKDIHDEPFWSMLAPSEAFERFKSFTYSYKDLSHNTISEEEIRSAFNTLRPDGRGNEELIVRVFASDVDNSDINCKIVAADSYFDQSSRSYMVNLKVEPYDNSDDSNIDGARIHVINSGMLKLFSVQKEYGMQITVDASDRTDRLYVIYDKIEDKPKNIIINYEYLSGCMFDGCTEQEMRHILMYLISPQAQFTGALRDLSDHKVGDRFEVKIDIKNGIPLFPMLNCAPYDKTTKYTIDQKKTNAKRRVYEKIKP